MRKSCPFAALLLEEIHICFRLVPINRRVGLGKALMATALARIFEDDFGLETLILCPKNLVKMV